MIRHTFSILFWIYKSRKNSQGQSPIYCRLTINGVRTELSTHRFIYPDEWDPKRGLAKGRTSDVQELNYHLEGLRQKLHNAETELIKTGREVTCINIKRILNGDVETKKGLIEVAEYHQEIIRERLNNGYSRTTILGYGTAIKYLKGFIKYKYRCPDIALNDIQHNFIVEFERYVKGHSDCRQNGTMNVIKKLKRITNFSIENGWLDKNPFLRYRAKYEPTNRPYLTLEEITKIERKKLNNYKLEKARDMFLFACYTGKGYKDLVHLSKENVATHLNGKKWLICERSKTHVQSDVPLLPKALELINKYKNHPKVKREGSLFPYISSQKLNDYLKVIARMSGVTKNLTFYLGRHTFATTVCSDNGVPIETISKMLGHTSLKTTQIYQKTTPHKVGVDMEKLEKELNKNTR